MRKPQRTRATVQADCLPSTASSVADLSQMGPLSTGARHASGDRSRQCRARSRSRSRTKERGTTSARVNLGEKSGGGAPLYARSCTRIMQVMAQEIRRREAQVGWARGRTEDAEGGQGRGQEATQRAPTRRPRGACSASPAPSCTAGKTASVRSRNAERHRETHCLDVVPQLCRLDVEWRRVVRLCAN